MKTALFIFVGLVVVVVLVLVVLYIAGSRLPREHRSQITVTLRAQRTVVWAAITDYSAMPLWWPMVKAVRTEKRPDGTELTWNTDARNKQIAFRTKSQRSGTQLVREIVGDEMPFGGTWTYDLADDAAGGTRLTITEDGFIKPPIFRALGTWFFGLDTTMKAYAMYLEKYLAEKKP